MSPSTRRAWIEILNSSRVFTAIISSPSTRRAWIEIFYLQIFIIAQRVALHPEGVDINCMDFTTCSRPDLSPSTRRAWIEIQEANDVTAAGRWSPSTRRAWIEIIILCARQGEGLVALHPEGVDRNIFFAAVMSYSEKSPSTRRAWIEILLHNP